MVMDMAMDMDIRAIIPPIIPPFFQSTSHMFTLAFCGGNESSSFPMK